MTQEGNNCLELRAAFFDLDGTLVDSETIYVEAVREALAARGFRLSMAEALSLVYGKGWRDIFAEVTRSFHGAYDSIDEMETVVRENFSHLRSTRDIRIVESIDLLRNLSRDLSVAIVSGSPREDVAAAINMMGVGGLLRFFLGCEDYAPGKPSPACYVRAAELMKVPPAACIVFEDSQAGVVAAKSAGMYCVGLARSGAPVQDLTQADQVVDTLGKVEIPHP